MASLVRASHGYRSFTGSNPVEVLNFFFSFFLFFFRLLTQLRSQLRSQLRESSDHSSFDVFEFAHRCLLLFLLCYGAVIFYFSPSLLAALTV